MQLGNEPNSHWLLRISRFSVPNYHIRTSRCHVSATETAAVRKAQKAERRRQCKVFKTQCHESTEMRSVTVPSAHFPSVRKPQLLSGSIKRSNSLSENIPVLPKEYQSPDVKATPPWVITKFPPIQKSHCLLLK